MSQNKHTTKFYDSISPGYDELYGREQLKKIAIIKKIIIDSIVDVKKSNNNENIKKNIDKYEILDIGCGSGISGIISKSIVGIDPSMELLKKAGIKKVNGVAESLPFKHHVFDIVISVTAIHNFSDIKKAVKEMKRVAKAKCVFIISILKKSRKLNEIRNILKKNFKVKGIIEEEKDIIFFCEG